MNNIISIINHTLHPFLPSPSRSLSAARQKTPELPHQTLLRTWIRDLSNFFQFIEEPEVTRSYVWTIGRMGQSLDLFLLQIFRCDPSCVSSSIIVMNDHISETSIWTLVLDLFEDSWEADICVPLSCDCLLTFQFDSLDKTSAPEEHSVTNLSYCCFIFHNIWWNLIFKGPQNCFPICWRDIKVDISSVWDYTVLSVLRVRFQIILIIEKSLNIWWNLFWWKYA